MNSFRSTADCNLRSANLSFSPFSFLRSTFSAFLILMTVVCGLLGNGAAFGQTNPAAFDLSTGSFSFTTQTATNTTYPTNIRGWDNGGTNNLATLSTTASTADISLTASATSSTVGIGNLGSSGFQFLTSSSVQTVGALAVALNATGRSNVLVTWTAADQSAGTGNRQMNLTLQYRTATTGAFTTVASSSYTTNAGSQAVAQTFTNIALPSACDNQAVVQIRWIYYESASQSGSRDPVRLDDITVSSSSAGNTAPTVTTGTAGTFSTTGAVITGNNVTSDGGVAVSERGIVFGLATGPTISGSKVTDGSAITGSFNSTLSGLTAGTTYFVRAYATNTIGTNYGSEISFPTIPGATTASAATSITSTGFTANWSATTSATKYFLDVATDSGFNSLVSGFNNLDVLNVTTRAVTGLSAGTTYYYRVRAFNASGTGASSGTITVTTATVAPTVTTTSPATSISTSAATLGGNVNSTGGASVTTRGFEYSTTNNFTNGTGTVVSETGTFSTGAYTLSVSGLNSGTVYYFKAFATNSSGTTYGAQVSFATYFSGSYSVGAGASVYSTLKSFFDAINSGTVAGNLTVNVVGDCSETATATLNSWTESPASSNYTMNIQPSGGAARTISGAITAGSPLIDLAGADRVTFNGLNTGGNSLTISNTTASATSGTSTIRFSGDATNNTITNSSVLGSSSSSTSTNGGNIFFHTGTSTGNDSNTISNCNIGPAGANLPTKAIYGSGSTSTTAINNSGNSITSNNIFDYFGAAVTSSGVFLSSGNTDWTISNNKFYQTAPRTQTTGAQHSAIQISNTSGNNFLISGNTIGFAAANGTGTYTLVAVSGTTFVPVSLNVGPTTATSVQGNSVAGIAISGAASGSSSTAPFRAIYVANGLTTIGNVTGNAIGSQSGTGSITYTSSSTSLSDLVGIFNFGNFDWTVSNNLIGGITASNSSTGASNLYGIRFNTLSSVNTTIQNNLIGGTIANSLQTTTTATGSQVVGLLSSTSNGTVDNNTIRNLTAAGGTGTATAASVIGLSFSDTAVNNTVSRNTIFSLTNTANTGATTVTGIQYTSASGANSITRNFIHSVSGSSTSAILNGIQVSGGTATYQNNMIRLGTITAAAAAINGISELAGTNNFYFNSIYLGGTGVGTTASNTFAFNSAVVTNVRRCVNNIFVNARSNAAAGGKHYAVRVGGTAPNPAGLTINYNNYLVTGTGGTFGSFNGADVASLSAWRTAVGQDGNSFNSDPKFINPNGTSLTVDLHIDPALSTPVESSGTPVADITADFDGDTRNITTPDVGADEGAFTPLPTIVSASPSSLSGFSTTFGTASAAQSFTASGSSLGGNITITAPTGYEVSQTSGTSGFASSQALAPDVSGTVADTTIFVRLTNTASAGATNGSVSVTATNATTQTVALTGTVTAVAPSVTTGAASAITISSATLGGNLTSTGGANATERGIYYSTTSGFADGTGTKVSATGSFPAGAYTISTSGLNSGTTYYFKAFATAPGGTAYGTEANFATLKTEPPNHVSNFTTGTITSTTIQVQWTGTSADGYLLRVSSGTPVVPVDGTAVVNKSAITSGFGDINLGGGTTSYSGFTGLLANTNYTFAIYPYNNAGAAIDYKTTGAPTVSAVLVPAAPATPTFASVTSSGFNVNWVAVSGATSYRLDVATDSNFTALVAGYSDLTVATTSQAVTGLGANTQYYARVRAVNTSGTSANSTAANQTTSQLSAPVASAATNVTSTGFTANWSSVTGATGYRVDVTAPAATSDLIISEYVEGSSNNKYIEIFNGTPSAVALSNYEVRLYNNGGSTPSNAVALAGSLASGQTLVLKNGSATVYAGTATSNAAVGYNGNDAVALYKTSTSSFVDIIGRIGEDPGTAWTTAGGASTADKTLRRKTTVLSGVTTNPASGFPTLATEWDVFDTDVVSGLGSHSSAALLANYNNVDAGAATNLLVTGLSPSSSYSYVVRATSVNSTSANSNTITVTTKGTSSVTLNSATAFTYSGSAQGPAFTFTGSTGTRSYAYTGTGATSYSGTTAPITAGSYTVTATVAADANFDVASSTPTAFTIGTKALTITGLSANNKTYDGSATATLSGAPSYVGLVNSESFSVSGTESATFADATAGLDKPVTVTGYTAPSANYNVTQPTGLTANIAKATPIITLAPSATSLVFGQTLASSTLSGGTASVPGTFAFTTPSTAPAVGTNGQSVTFTPTGAANYNNATTAVSVTVISIYANWASGFPGFTDTASGSDPDNDQISNLLEFAFGTDPTVSSTGVITYANGVISANGQPTTSITNITNGVDYRAVFGRRKDYVNAGLTYTVQFSAGMDAWVDSTATPSVVASDANMDAVSVPYPFFIVTARGVEKPTFFRVAVSSN